MIVVAAVDVVVVVDWYPDWQSKAPYCPTYYFCFQGNGKRQNNGEETELDSIRKLVSNKS